MTSKYAFAGEGAVLNEDGPDVGKGKGKQAKRYVVLVIAFLEVKYSVF